MALNISVELSHVCPLDEIPKHAAALESLGYYRVWVPDIDIPIYLAAMSVASWKTAVRVADGVATIFSDEMADIRTRAMVEKTLPTAALIPFSLSQDDFFEGWNRARSLEELQEGVRKIEAAGIEEVIVAYREMVDLEIAARLIK